MREIMSCDTIELASDLSELKLHAGDKGLVRTTWHYPNLAYEVEFRLENQRVPIRVLLLDHQIRRDSSAFDQSVSLYL